MQYPLEVNKEIFFSGVTAPDDGYSCHCNHVGGWGSIDIFITLADGRAYTTRAQSVMRSPYSPDVLQIYFSTIQHWDNGTPMTSCEQRQIAMIICQQQESQLYNNIPPES